MVFLPAVGYPNPYYWVGEGYVAKLAGRNTFARKQFEPYIGEGKSLSSLERTLLWGGKVMATCVLGLLGFLKSGKQSNFKPQP
jgi:hypothetical protein